MTINNNSANYYEVVQAGSSLTLKSNTNTVFNFGSATLSVGRMIFNGNIYCINQAINTSGGPRLYAQDSIIINKLFYIGPYIAGANGSNPTGANKFRMSNGSTYQIDRNGGVVIGGLWETGSLIKITGSVTGFPSVWLGPAVYGSIEYDVPNAAITTISNLVIPTNTVFLGDFKVTNLGTSGGIRLASNPGSITINGNFIINNGKVNLSSGNSPTTINVKGDFLQSIGTTVDLQASSANTLLKVGGNINAQGSVIETGTSIGSGIELNGSVSQNISMGIVSNDVSLTINNAAGAVALTDITLPADLNSKLNLTLGNLNVKTNNKTFYVQNPSSNAIVGGSVNAHVIGALKRSINSTSAYQFPISDDNTSFANATLNMVNTNKTDWTIEFIRSNPNSATGLPAGINLIAPYRWEISRSVGSATEVNTVNLNYASIIGNGVLIPANIKVVRWNNTSWDNLGGLLDGAGGITSSITPISNFGAFSIGGPTGSLPVKIQYFTGKNQSNINKLFWKVNCTNASFLTTNIERSSDGRNYQSIYQLKSDAVRCLQAFDYADFAPIKGINYYRLNTADEDGTVTYSNVVALKVSGINEWMQIIPNPVLSEAMFNIESSSIDNLQLVVTDRIGRKVYSKSVKVVEGNNSIPLALGFLKSGAYTITSYNSNGVIGSVSFIKK